MRTFMLILSALLLSLSAACGRGQSAKPCPSCRGVALVEVDSFEPTTSLDELLSMAIVGRRILIEGEEVSMDGYRAALARFLDRTRRIAEAQHRPYRPMMELVLAGDARWADIVAVVEADVQAGVTEHHVWFARPAPGSAGAVSIQLSTGDQADGATVVAFPADTSWSETHAAVLAAPKDRPVVLRVAR